MADDNEKLIDDRFIWGDGDIKVDKPKKDPEISIVPNN